MTRGTRHIAAIKSSAAVEMIKNRQLDFVSAGIPRSARVLFSWARWKGNGECLPLERGMKARKKVRKHKGGLDGTMAVAFTRDRARGGVRFWSGVLSVLCSSLILRDRIFKSVRRGLISVTCCCCLWRCRRGLIIILNEQAPQVSKKPWKVSILVKFWVTEAIKCRERPTRN